MKKSILAVMIMGLTMSMLVGCGNGDAQSAAAGNAESGIESEVDETDVDTSDVETDDSNDDGVVAEIEYNPDVNKIPTELEANGLETDQIKIDPFTLSLCIPKGYKIDYDELYGDKDYFSTDYITDDFVMGTVTIFNYSDMGATALTTLLNDTGYENSEIKETTVNGVLFHYAVRGGKTDEGLDTVWTMTCDLGDGWIYEARVAGLDMDREIPFEEVKDFMNIAMTK